MQAKNTQSIELQALKLRNNQRKELKNIFDRLNAKYDRIPASELKAAIEKFMNQKTHTMPQAKKAAPAKKSAKHVSTSKAAKSASQSKTAVSKAGKIEAKKPAKIAPTRTFEDPNSPATKGQTFTLFVIAKTHGLKKTDYRNDGLTKKKAQALIDRLNAKFGYKKPA